MIDSEQSSHSDNDPWLLDTFSWFDHDHKNPRYLKILNSRKYKLFGNWPFLLKDASSQNPLKAELKILALGGSTTSIVNNSTWTDHLFALLSKRYSSVALFNGGCGLYNSFNEYMKLSRDILFMNPTHVISLSGVNDTHVSDAHSNSFAAMLIPPLVGGNIYTRPNADFPVINRVARWLDESKNMDAICRVHNARFFRFLQPCLCSKGNEYSALSDELKELVHWMGDFGMGDGRARVGRDNYIQAVQRFYFSLDAAALPEYIRDITSIIPSENDCWHDARHPTDIGYMRIAHAIFENIFD